jgi:hypothetical protein
MNIKEQVALVENIKELVEQYEKGAGRQLHFGLLSDVTVELKRLKKEQMFGFDVHADDRYCMRDREGIYFFGEGKGSISWEDNRKKPVDEWLYEIHFPTGAYIFGEHYPKELFNAFFDELKTYNPAFLDSHNNCLYFRPANAKVVFDALPTILEKYYKRVNEDAKRMRIEALKAELERLKEEEE